MAEFLIFHFISSSKAYFTTELLSKYSPLLVSVWWGLEAITAWKPPLPVRDDQWHEWGLLWIHSQSPRIKLLDSISTYNWWLVRGVWPAGHRGVCQKGLQKIFFSSLNIGVDWVMKRWHVRAPWPGMFPKCHFINHWMGLSISWFSPDYIIEITLDSEYIYQTSDWEAHKKY